MIDAIEPLHCVLWAVAALAAGMYPLGLMLGGTCSDCCRKDCEPIFHRCLRELTTGGVAPVTPSKSIHTLSEAGIRKASSYADVTLQVANSNSFLYLSPGEQIRFEYDMNISVAGGGVECFPSSKTVALVINGIPIPLTFGDVSLFSNFSRFSALPASWTATRTLLEGLDAGGRQCNWNTPATASVVDADFTGGGGRVDGSLVTKQSLMSSLSVEVVPPNQQNLDTYLVLNVNLNLEAFAGILFPDDVVVRWLVRTERAGQVNESIVSAFINAPRRDYRQSPSPVQSAANIAPMRAPQRAGPWGEPVAPRLEVDGDEIRMIVTPSKGSTSFFNGEPSNVVASFPLQGRCRLGHYGAAARVNMSSNARISGTLAPTLFEADDFARLVAAALYFPEDTIAFFHPQESRPDGGVYDAELVAQYRDGAASLPFMHGTRPLLSLLAAPSRLCGMSACDLPKELLPPAVTYRPAEGVKYGCKPAVPVTLGNAAGGCIYRHTTTECMAERSFFIDVRHLFKDWGTFPTNVDALTWLEKEPLDAHTVVSNVPLDNPLNTSGTYTAEGTYDWTFMRPGYCYTDPDVLTASASTDGQCLPAEITINVSNIQPCTPWQGVEIYNPDAWLPFLKSQEGNYVVRAVLGAPDAHVDFYAPSGRWCPLASMQYSSGERQANLASGIYGASVRISHYECKKQAYSVALATPDILDIEPFGIAISPKNLHLDLWALWSPDGSVDVSYDAYVSGKQVDGRTLFFWRTFRREDGSAYYKVICYSATVRLIPSGQMSQCSGGVSFEPTEVTIPLDKPNTLTYGRPDVGEKMVRATGQWRPCGYDGQMWYRGPADTPQFGGDEKINWSGLSTTKSVVLPVNSDSEPATYVVPLTSDGSPPTNITVTRPGRCTDIRHPSAGKFRTTGATVVVPRLDRCVEIPVQTGRTCRWTASVTSGTATIEESTATGIGDGRVKVSRSIDGSIECVVRLSLDSPTPNVIDRFDYDTPFFDVFVVEGR